MLPRTKTLKSKFFAGFHSFIFLECLFYDKIYTFISIVYEPVLSLRGARAARLVQLKIYAVLARRGSRTAYAAATRRGLPLYYLSLGHLTGVLPFGIVDKAFLKSFSWGILLTQSKHQSCDLSIGKRSDLKFSELWISGAD